MAKANKSSEKKEMSEGKAIALAVLLFVVGSIGVFYILRFIIKFFFPGWID